MGHNVDFTQLLGLPEKINCPRCNRQTNSNFEDYDIDCGEPNPQPGKWILDCCCGHCEYEFEYNFEVKLDITEEVY